MKYVKGAWALWLIAALVLYLTKLYDFESTVIILLTCIGAMVLLSESEDTTK